MGYSPWSYKESDTTERLTHKNTAGEGKIRENKLSSLWVPLRPDHRRYRAERKTKDFPGGPVTRTPVSTVGGTGLIPGWKTKIMHAAWLS